MAKPSLLLSDLDIDALVDQALPDDRRAALVRQAHRDAPLADHMVDEAFVSELLKQHKDDLYQDDPDLAEAVSVYMTRYRLTNRNRG